ECGQGKTRVPLLRARRFGALLEVGDQRLQIAVTLAVELRQALHGKRRERLREDDRRIARDQRGRARTARRLSFIRGGRSARWGRGAGGGARRTLRGARRRARLVGGGGRRGALPSARGIEILR